MPAQKTATISQAIKNENSSIYLYISEIYSTDYNYRRLHSAIGYATPYDKLLGLDVELMKERKTKLEKARKRRKQAWGRIKPTETENLVAS